MKWEGAVESNEPESDSNSFCTKIILLHISACFVEFWLLPNNVWIMIIRKLEEQ